MVAFALLALSFAGCAEEPEEAPPLLGWCPQWAQGAPVPLTGALENRTHSVVLAPDNTSDGRPLDVLRLDLQVQVENATLFLEVWDADRGRLAILRDHRLEPGKQVQPQARFSVDQEVRLEAALNAIDADELHSGPFRLEWRLEGGGTATWTGEATPLYRVCGV